MCEEKLLRQRLHEAEETLDAIRSGWIDAVVVEGGGCHHVYTLESADLPYRQFLENMGEGAVSMDGFGTILYCNRFFADLVGKSRGEVLGLGLQALVTEEHRACFEQALSATELSRLGVTLYGEGQRRIPVQLAVRPVPSHEGRRLTVVVSDLSQRERLKAAEAESQAKDRLLAAVGHDLRTPLNVVIGWTSVLLETKDSFDELTQQALDVIYRNAKLQGKLIQDVLDVSRIASGKLKLERVPLALGELVSSSARSLDLAAGEKGVTLTVQAEPDLIVDGDPTRIEQVLHNLIGNAIKFTPPGGHVQVSVRRHGDWAQLVVADDGEGIPEELLPHVFDVFRQGQPGAKGGGLGLGLSIAKRLVELHEGRISAASLGHRRGASFTVELPLARAQPGVPPAFETRVARGQRLKGLRVLVADDESEMRAVTCRLLRIQGAEVEDVTSATAALSRLAQERFDVVVSEVSMGDLDGDGLELARTIRSRHGSEIPVLAVSALGSDSDRQRALDAGFSAYLEKPLDAQALCGIVHELAVR